MSDLSTSFASYAGPGPEEMLRQYLVDIAMHDFGLDNVVIHMDYPEDDIIKLSIPAQDPQQTTEFMRGVDFMLYVIARSTLQIQEQIENNELEDIGTIQITFCEAPGYDGTMRFCNIYFGNINTMYAFMTYLQKSIMALGPQDRTYSYENIAITGGKPAASRILESVFPDNRCSGGCVSKNKFYSHGLECERFETLYRTYSLFEIANCINNILANEKLHIQEPWKYTPIH